ncbi:GNAT family N-acetyltransferase [Halodesulfovibrio marinisediminis]|uniref:Acetyltransferase (GNAT) family protein n=1 Tax=Halodesulfovibrio marinisediminis DSM 17456 TaxID=1121457 RepID=A0A1N6I7G3_9BACT|nr:GNAT family N-acetyltransferase [Halodesulfovibrio marinisediminis]SIO27953.1 Acetyltransferase (GNAT) family protein [Halodesulfovibrio marinisediminis DSM 17456]
MESIVTLTAENIDDEHICCAIADKKCAQGYQAKKDWLATQFPNGYVFKKGDVRGKVFIEYVPAEHAWVPVDAPNYLLINCFWVSGKYKGKGNGKKLFEECMADAKGKDGVIVVTGKTKQPFMSDKRFFKKQGFELLDVAPPYFELWGKRFSEGSPVPAFKESAKTGECSVRDGLAVFYTNACPFTEYYVEDLVRVATARGKNITVTKFTSKEEAQAHCVPYTNYTVFNDGKFVTQRILSEKEFDKVFGT